MFVGGLSDDLTDSDLREYFNEFGNIVNITIATQKGTGRKRGFAFVEYDDYDPVDKIVCECRAFLSTSYYVSGEKR